MPPEATPPPAAAPRDRGSALRPLPGTSLATPSGLSLDRYRERLRDTGTVRVSGHVSQVIGLYVEVDGLPGRLGEMCAIDGGSSGAIAAEIVGFKGDHTLVMPLADLRGVHVGARVTSGGTLFSVPVGTGLLGRVVNGLGEPIDGRGPLVAETWRAPLAQATPHVLERRRIEQPLATGVRAIDGLLTCGKGQRIGIFAGSGVGKSTVLGMIARNTTADANVIALIGERGREVREFIERDLGPEGLERSVVVVSTSDEPALLRMKAAWVATTIAEDLRARRMDVTLLMDSVTRFAMAQREIGLAIGEPPAVKGYTPSVFAQLARLLERTGTSDEGTITGIYTVLVESDDLTEPVTDTVRGTLDGHIVLTRDLATRNHWPAIDILQSTSRVMGAVVTPQHAEAAARLRELLATYEASRDLVAIGAYQAGSDRRLDDALRHLPAIEQFLRQRPTEHAPFAETVGFLGAAVSEGPDDALEPGAAGLPTAERRTDDGVPWIDGGAVADDGPGAAPWAAVSGAGAMDGPTGEGAPDYGALEQGALEQGGLAQGALAQGPAPQGAP